MTPLLDKIEKQNMDIERQIKEIKEAENMRKEFSANVSHELKTPLTTISGYAELDVYKRQAFQHLEIMKKHLQIKRQANATSIS